MLPDAKNQGFTLVELMIAVLILAVVTAQTFVVFSTQKRVFTQNERTLDVQEDARLVVDLIAFDTRQAGFMVPKAAAVSSFDGGTSNPDRYCISDASYFDFPTGTQTSDGLDNQRKRFDGGSVVTAVGTGVTVTSTDIDSDNGSTDFVVDGGVILSDGVSSHCARLATVVGTTLTLEAGHGVPGGLFPVIGNVSAVPAVVYEVDGSDQLLRNNQVLATSVEDLQIEYWVDSGLTPGQVDVDEFPVHDLNAPPGALAVDTTAIRSVRISVIAKAVAEEAGPNQKFDLFSRPASGNRTAGAADSFRRRRFQASVMPRNLLGVL